MYFFLNFVTLIIYHHTLSTTYITNEILFMSHKSITKLINSSLKWLFFIIIAGIILSSLNANAAVGYVNIFVVKSRDLLQYNICYDTFMSTLDQAGINYHARVYSLDKQITSIDGITTDIDHNRPDLILTIGTEASQEISRRIYDIPIIFSMVLNPRAQGLSVIHHKNLTGVCLDTPVTEQLGKIKLFIPQLKRIALLYNPVQDSSFINEARVISGKIGIEINAIEIKSEIEIDSLLLKIRNTSDLLLLIPNPYTMNYLSLKHIFKECIYNNFPVIGLSEFHVKAGALMAIRADYADSGRQACYLAIELIRTGKLTPNTIITPGLSKVFINKRAADNMGLTIPSKLLRQAKIIYE